MSREKKLFPVKEYLIYHPVDLGKQWFVYWYELGKRKKKYGEINQGETYQKRMDLARELIRELKAAHRPKFSKTESTIWKYIEQNKHLWKPRTYSEYVSMSKVLFQYLNGREVTQQLIQDFLQGLRATRHTTTWNKYRYALKRLFDGVGATYLFEDIKPIKTIKTPARYFQSHQAAQLAQVIAERDADLWLFVQFIYYCFIRPTELRHLQVGDLMLDEREIRMPGNKTKNKKTEYVAIPDIFVPALEPLYYRSPAEYIFPSPKKPNKPLSKNVMYRRHKKILDSLNYGEGYSLYSWKHTGAVAAAKAGVGIKELQIQLRHHSLDQTDEYLRQMGVRDVHRIRNIFPPIGARLTTAHRQPGASSVSGAPFPGSPDPQ
ncbi:tyrosine-type recombinase/integrase [Flavilitoribacter nigricans]|uniref:Tyr recombinase domain-containing protein n=1 Tax=Flavilitoribacter nigricans (strain ATCC 23147 / DSM 23189 / NBRC 102662 / NCIMB 1420 / SS-2) TaxID=1122177 RepID=A0A2D0NF06_FLAN2|nr:site-specific integrase [Flavilitoribacter nigricans]PHN06936.1 hypothetical protein CRP01_08970 [Flavilitoribacter nigricans DSM 23189 = NBRC 102662]